MGVLPVSSSWFCTIAPEVDVSGNCMQTLGGCQSHDVRRSCQTSSGVMAWFVGILYEDENFPYSAQICTGSCCRW